MNNTKRIAIIGDGRWSKITRKYYEELFDIACVADSHSDLTSILSNDNIDAVAIITPPDTHHSIARLAIKNNKHVFCEKPLDKFVSGVDELYALSKEHKVAILTDYTHIFSLGLYKTKDIMYGGTLGKIESITIQITKWAQPTDRHVNVLLLPHAYSIATYLSEEYDIDRVNIQSCGNSKRKTVRLKYDDYDINILADTACHINNTWVSIQCEYGCITYNQKDHKTITTQFYDSRDIEIYQFDEKNNVKYALQKFSDLMKTPDYSRYYMDRIASFLIERI